jgi:hypothetical protein
MWPRRRKTIDCNKENSAKDVVRCVDDVTTIFRKTIDIAMWTDNETELDFLNFTGIADTVTKIVVQAQAPWIPSERAVAL